jgi:phosphohistidine phosphatase
MKTLILLRHGKSDWSSDSGKDHDRPLAPRGRHAARTVGRFLAAAGQTPDGVVTSTAVRARTTAELAVDAGGWGCEVEATRELYDTTPAAVLAVLRRQPDRFESLLLAGHQPTWSGLAGALVGGGDVRMVTGAMVRIDLAVESWAEVDFNRGTLVWLLPPKLLQKAGFE